MSAALEQTTVIIPTHNRSKLLLEALESVFSQTLQPAEIIVADDGSTDDTETLMAQFAGRIRYFRKPNTGKSDTLNQSLKIATSPLIWIMDDDDIALPGALEAMTRAISGQPEIGFVYGRYLRFRVDPKTGARRTWECGYWRNVGDSQFFRANLEDFFAHHPGLLVRRAAYETVGGFSRVYSRSEDYEMLIRLADRFACSKTDEIVFLQRQHDGRRFGGLAADQRMQRWIEEQLELFKEIRTTLPIASYLPRPLRETPLTDALMREALIVRGAVMARKKLWNEAFEDFQSACQNTSIREPLTATERDAVRQMLFSKYGSSEVALDPTVGRALLALRGMGPVGQSLARTLSRSLIWFIRKDIQAGRLTRAARYSSLALMLLRRQPASL